MLLSTVSLPSLGKLNRAQAATLIAYCVDSAVSPPLLYVDVDSNLLASQIEKIEALSDADKLALAANLLQRLRK